MLHVSNFSYEHIEVGVVCVNRLVFDDLVYFLNTIKIVHRVQVNCFELFETSLDYVFGFLISKIISQNSIPKLRWFLHYSSMFVFFVVGLSIARCVQRTIVIKIFCFLLSILQRQMFYSEWLMHRVWSVWVWLTSMTWGGNWTIWATWIPKLWSHTPLK